MEVNLVRAVRRRYRGPGPLLVAKSGQGRNEIRRRSYSPFARSASRFIVRRPHSGSVSQKISIIVSTQSRQMNTFGPAIYLSRASSFVAETPQNEHSICVISHRPFLRSRLPFAAFPAAALRRKNKNFRSEGLF